MEEAAPITKFAITLFSPVFAFLGLVVRMDSTKSSLAKMLWKSIVRLS